MMKHIHRIEDLPDQPALAQGLYRPRVTLWQDVRWTLRGIAPEPESDYLDLSTSRPAVLLMGCSYVAGDYLPSEARLLAQMRRLLPEAAVSSIAASGGGLISNLAHIGLFLPASYRPRVVFFSPSQSFRQFIPESTNDFNATPYSLWRQYYFVHAHGKLQREWVEEELLQRDLLRLSYLADSIFPTSMFFLTLWDSQSTSEITLISPREREALEAFCRVRPRQCRMALDREAMLRLYDDLGPFEANHPSSDQVKCWAEVCAGLAREVLVPTTGE